MGGTALAVAAIFMAITKDNILIESDVPAIKRENKDRERWLCADASLLGVALAIIGGLGFVNDDVPVEETSVAIKQKTATVKKDKKKSKSD